MTRRAGKSVPHPIPYQGSKRRLAPAILARFPARVDTLYEPFAGSAAVTLAAASSGAARRFRLNDSLEPLMAIWQATLDDPDALADRYEALWAAQLGDERAFYDHVRDAFNADPRPGELLFLLARCVKGAVRFNSAGEFNQSPDNRRRGARPDHMRARLLGAHRLLAGRTVVRSGDFRRSLASASSADLVYLDPPYQGTSYGRDRRYLEPLAFDHLVASLDDLNTRGVPFLLSFDGRCGGRSYGRELPHFLGLQRVELPAGRSSQATLHGRREQTFESLYVSPGLADEADDDRPPPVCASQGPRVSSRPPRA